MPISVWTCETIVTSNAQVSNRDSVRVGSAKIFLEIDLRLPATKYDSSTGMKDKAKGAAYSSAAWSAFSSTSGPSMWDLSEYLMSTPFKLLSLHMSIVETEAFKHPLPA